MFARFEKRTDALNEKIWINRWLNLKNVPHWHDETEIVFCEKGSCCISFPNEKINIENGQAALIECCAIHSIASSDGAVTVTLQFDDSLMKNTVSTRMLNNRMLTNADLILPYLLKIAEELKEKRSFYKKNVEAYSALLLTEIFRNEHNHCAESIKQTKRSLLAKEIANNIEKNISFVTFDDLCAKFNYSAAHFSRLFSRLFGVSFTEYVSAVRIERAVRMIKNENKIITHIASECGFNSIRNFNRCFKKLTGFSPRELPDGFFFSRNVVKVFGESYDPTEKTSLTIPFD